MVNNLCSEHFRKNRDNLAAFKEKTVMAENRSDDPEIRPWNQTRPFFHAPCREQTVRVDADHRCGSLDVGEGRFDTASPTPRVVEAARVATRVSGSASDCVFTKPS